MKTRFCRFTALLFLIFSVATTVVAQVDTGVLSGTVFDNSDAVVPGVKVTLTNIGTNYSLENYSLELETNAAGLYVSPPLQPGTYRIEVRQEGFQPVAKEIQLSLRAPGC
ncbi:MAG: carboxypeptidase-like regulatory domain-containing protein [Bryobacterales bacterium]|nr:carboxypeptidase-like regulatory domain-containing protein [Bryobacterales bacterium]